VHATAPVSEASNAFGFRLYQQLSQRDAGKNILISPLSISAGLAMVYNGANGQTKSEMAKALGWQALELPQLNGGYQTLLTSLQHTDKRSSLEMADALMVQKKFSLRSDFTRRCRDSYQAGLETTDFSGHEADARKKINRWIEQKTHGKILNMLQQPLPSETMLVLIDTLYFKADWQHRFEGKKTDHMTFTCADGTKKYVMTMCNTEDYDCFVTNGLQAVRLPYTADGTSMEIYLPAKSLGLTTFRNQLAADKWRSWSHLFSRHPCTLHLPHFTADYNLDLKETLQRLGMRVAFTTQADLSGTASGLSISNVFQHGMIKVNEDGTEAAAAFAGVEPKSIPKPAKPQPYDITVDHPFFYAIRAKDGTILFLGSIADPTLQEVKRQPRSHGTPNVSRKYHGR